MVMPSGMKPSGNGMWLGHTDEEGRAWAVPPASGTASPAASNATAKYRTRRRVRMVQLLRRIDRPPPTWTSYRVAAFIQTASRLWTLTAHPSRVENVVPAKHRDLRRCRPAGPNPPRRTGAGRHRHTLRWR